MNTDDELWTVAQVAEFLDCSQSRARAQLANHGITRVSGYPASQVKRIQKRQGARTDLTPTPPDTRAIDEFGPPQLRAITALRDGLPHTLDDIAFEPLLGRVDRGMKILMQSALTHLVRRGYATQINENSWKITETGRHALESTTSPHHDPPPA
ncbi:Uncharacterised protein [Mycobacteroides abscessus subsp. massiliense]|uniref:Uncharacterized protein n=1 Tax=Mycobacteroides abscessus subsp. massiliense TaxID=1962118 RepID=A0A1T8VWU8_9MYCO|nr:hypothetical protein [Mycobacteroides abscessus]SKN09317.1 Uncharacterised protein [Mycobacteroides abscessus subsp. massiliense]